MTRQKTNECVNSIEIDEDNSDINSKENNSNDNKYKYKNNEEEDEMEEEKENKKAKSFIFNMIILKSGNIAISRKEAVEIYNFNDLEFPKDKNYIRSTGLKNNEYLLQRINLVKGKYIRYVLQLFDETLLCASFSKIFRIKLINEDANYELLSYIKMGQKEISTKIISLDTSFLVVLAEQKTYCHLKIFQKISGEEKNNLLKNKINDENVQKNNNEMANSNSNNCGDVPPIGNCSLFSNKEICEDKSFKQIYKNIHKEKTVLISIYPISKKSNSFNKNSDDNNENYLYEFIATSNCVYNSGKDIVEFYGIKAGEKGAYNVKKIKEITGISCSTEADSICQISNRYLCIGLKKHNFKGQKSGFAIIDIFKRENYGIIRDQEISCIFFNPKNQLLFASMEVRNTKKYYFSTKIYKINNVEDEIEFEKIYQYNNKQDDVITSILQINSFDANLNDQNNLNNIIFLTSSNDSTLEIVRAGM